MEALPLHMLMVECAKDIDEFVWVLNEGVAVRSASSESIQSISKDEPADEQQPGQDSEDE